MAKDHLANRFAQKQKGKKLGDLADKARGKDDMDAEKELLEKTDKVEPIKADAAPGRNEPCSCGSGKKFKKCCGAK